MNRLPQEKRIEILNMLVEGMSMRGTARVAGVSYGAVRDLLEGVGEECKRFHHQFMREVDVDLHTIECDEMWSFCYAKDKSIRQRRVKGKIDINGSLWTWTAIDRDTKLVISWLTGLRTSEFADAFMHDFARRIKYHVVNIATDGAAAYEGAIRMYLTQGRVNYTMLNKVYENGYYKGTVRGVVLGDDPDWDEQETTTVERHNVTMRQANRRLARKTTGFSKKATNHILQLCLYFVHYNWMRPHMTLTAKSGGKPTTPAMKAGLAKAPLSWAAILRGMDTLVPPTGPRGAYTAHIRPKARTANAKRRADRELVQGARDYGNSLRGGETQLVRRIA